MSAKVCTGLVLAVLSVRLGAYEVVEDFENPETQKRILERTKAGTQSGLKVEFVRRFATSGKVSLHVTAPKWHKGIVEWPVVSIPFGRTIDATPYDRILVDMYNDADGGDCIVWYACGDDANMDLGKRFQTILPAFGYRRWVTDLLTGRGWPATMDPSKVTRCDFFLHSPQNMDLYVDRIILLKKGEPEPEPSREFIEGTLKEQVRREFTEISASKFVTDEQRQAVGGFLGDAAATSDDAAAFRRRIAKLKAKVAHLEAHAAFRRTCGGQEFLVGCATTMEQVLPRDRNAPRPAKRFDVRLARNETEGFQVIVSPTKGALGNVRVEVGGLRGPGGIVFPQDGIRVGVIGHTMFTNSATCGRSRNVKTSAGVGYRRETEMPQLGWWPDSILDFLPSCTVGETDFQGFWVSFRCPSGQAPGLYSGTVTVSADGVASRRFPLSVRVRDFELPRTPPMPLIVDFKPWYRSYAGDPFWKLKDDPEAPIHVWKKHEREWTDFLADHFVTPDDLYHGGVSCLRIPEWKHLKEQGRLGRINICYFQPPGFDDAAFAEWEKEGLPRIKVAYEELKRHGLLDHAYVYGGDELNGNAFPMLKRMVAAIHAVCPGVPVATTSHDNSYGVETGLGYDWYIRTTQDFEVNFGARTEKARAAGRKVFWYTCDGPYPTFANFYLHSPAIEGRLLMGAMAQRMKPDGYLMYQMAIWNSTRPITSGPYTDWQVVTMGDKPGLADWAHVGPDGMPVTTIRFENFRDGVEDLMYAKELERKLAAHVDKNDAWAKNATALLAVPKDIMDTMRNYTDDPERLYAWRDGMADLIEGVK